MQVNYLATRQVASLSCKPAIHMNMAQVVMSTVRQRTDGMQTLNDVGSHRGQIAYQPNYIHKL